MGSLKADDARQFNGFLNLVLNIVYDLSISMRCSIVKIKGLMWLQYVGS